jgi:hypothetical protein
MSYLVGHLGNQCGSSKPLGPSVLQNEARYPVIGIYKHTRVRASLSNIMWELERVQHIGAIGPSPSSISLR